MPGRARVRGPTHGDGTRGESADTLAVLKPARQSDVDLAGVVGLFPSL
jgi:hypothetical protein